MVKKVFEQQVLVSRPQGFSSIGYDVCLFITIFFIDLLYFSHIN